MLAAHYYAFALVFWVVTLVMRVVAKVLLEIASVQTTPSVASFMFVVQMKEYELNMSG